MKRTEQDAALGTWLADCVGLGHFIMRGSIHERARDVTRLYVSPCVDVHVCGGEDDCGVDVRQKWSRGGEKLSRAPWRSGCPTGVPLVSKEHSPSSKPFEKSHDTAKNKPVNYCLDFEMPC
jgi:hypothetical protein